MPSDSESMHLCKKNIYIYNFNLLLPSNGME